MIWLVWITCLAILALLGRVLIRLNRMETRLKQVDEGHRVRQGKIAGDRTTFQSPKVDSRARTVTRDTDDLPRSGRMVQGVKRVRSDYVRPTDDSELL